MTLGQEEVARIRRHALELFRSGAVEEAKQALLVAIISAPLDRFLIDQFRDVVVFEKVNDARAASLKSALLCSPSNPVLWLHLALAEVNPTTQSGSDDSIRRFSICAEDSEPLIFEAVKMLNQAGLTSSGEYVLQGFIQNSCRTIRLDNPKSIQRSMGILDRCYNRFWGSATLAAKLVAAQSIFFTTLPPLRTIPLKLPEEMDKRVRVEMLECLQGNEKSITDKLKRCLVEFPKYPSLYFILGEFYSNFREKYLESRYFDFADRIFPGDRTVRHRLAHGFTASGKYLDALGKYLEELQLETKNIDLEKALTGRIGVDENGVLIWMRPDKLAPISQEPKFTFIVCAYKYPEFLRILMNKLHNQTYKNIEIIVINNGGGVRIQQIIDEVALKDARVLPITYEDEQYSKEDPLRFVGVCLNEALRQSQGDFVIDINDDDFVDETYAEKMVALFQGNPACIAASGLIERVDDNNKSRGNYDYYNNRPKYIPGILISLSTYLARIIHQR